MDVAGVLQETEDAESRAYTRSRFVLLLIVLSWLVDDSFLCLFRYCSFFAFFASCPVN